MNIFYINKLIKSAMLLLFAAFLDLCCQEPNESDCFDCSNSHNGNFPGNPGGNFPGNPGGYSPDDILILPEIQKSINCAALKEIVSKSILNGQDITSIKDIFEKYFQESREKVNINSYRNILNDKTCDESDTILSAIARAKILHPEGLIKLSSCSNDAIRLMALSKIIRHFYKSSTADLCLKPTAFNTMLSIVRENILSNELLKSLYITELSNEDIMAYVTYFGSKESEAYKNALNKFFMPYESIDLDDPNNFTLVYLSTLCLYECCTVINTLYTNDKIITIKPMHIEYITQIKNIMEKAFIFSELLVSTQISSKDNLNELTDVNIFKFNIDILYALSKINQILDSEQVAIQFSSLYKARAKINQILDSEQVAIQFSSLYKARAMNNKSLETPIEADDKVKRWIKNCSQAEFEITEQDKIAGLL